MPELALDTPTLVDAGKRFRRQWLYHWILNPQRVKHQAAMPEVLPTNDAHAAHQAAVDIVAYLSGESTRLPDGEQTSVDADVDALDSDDLIDAGELLYEDLGCIACHRFTPPEESDDVQRLSLDYVSAKYRPTALVEFLREPHAYHTSRPMPDFRLSETEAHQLAAFVVSQSRGELDEVDLAAGNPVRGRVAYEQFGCVACHAVEQGKLPRRDPIVSLDDWDPDELGCLSNTPEDRLPRYDFDPAEIDALTVLLDGNLDSIESTARSEASRRLVDTLRCAACHRRDGSPDDLTGLVLDEGVQGLAPQGIPDLSWTGEKLKETWMHPFIEGRLSYEARPWIRARMPEFGPYAGPLARGLPAEHGYSGASRPAPQFDRRLAEIGRDLTLQKGGFFCIECHATDQSRPVTAFDRHRGIDFPHVASRLQYDYYRRWLLAPKRIDPVTSMPEFAGQPKPGVLNGEIEQQFDAIWHYLMEIRHAATVDRD